jgi:uncharacterized protein YfaS (alpha-2-macroglobulin family)
MQRARWFALALVLCACVGWTAEKQPLNLDEANIRIRLLPAPLLELPVVNNTGKPLEGSFRLEFLDSDGKSAAWTMGTFREEPGTTVEKIPWDASKLPSNEPSRLVWYRLRYEFTPDAASGVAPARGVIQVGSVLRDTFELRMTASGHAVPGAKYPVRVRVDDPKNGRPMAGVAVEVKLDIDGDDAAVTRKVVTNSAGYATATFNLPSVVDSNEVRVYATATRGPFQEETYIDFKFPEGNRITLSTDKPLYQPGQTAHMRVTVFGPNKRALAGTPVKLTIEDEDSEEQFRQTVTTSRFGIASADWDIPQKLRLGDYLIKVALGDEYYGQQAKIRISRYDLPTYSVVVTPDRPYFLPGQDANVEVRADYLFGKPVQHAKVRVVRRNEWEWSYRDQKWEGEEIEQVEGQLDASGKFIAHISLKKDFENFTPNQWRRFDNLDLAAYVTDLSTGRTEQRRFQLRLSAMPVHLYVLNSGTGSTDAPLVLYVTSSYADGTPASVNGNIMSFPPNAQGECDEQPDAADRVTQAKFRTNQFGVGRVDLRPLAPELLVISRWARLYHSPEYENQRNGCLLLEAADRRGNRGADIETLGLEQGRAFLSVQTDHALYRAGDPILVSILSNTTVREAVVDLSGASGLLVSEVVHLDHGRAQITFPYDHRFHGQLDVAAFAIAGSEEKNTDLTGERQVLFPGRQELELTLRMAKSILRPGEEATADVAVRSPDGTPVESALGVLVYDRAVAERVRTDQQFSGEYGFNIYDFFDAYYGQGIAGITYRDLTAWDPAKPFPEGLDLVAEAILAYTGRYESEGRAEFTGSGAYHDGASSSVFENLIALTTTPISEALKKEYKDTDRYPRDAAGLKEILRSHGLDFNATLDPWDISYRAEFSVSGQQDVLTLISNGPDKRPGTKDDFTVLTLGWPYFRPLGKLMNEAVFAYQRETGKYIRDYPTLRDEMKKRGADLDALRDPWGRPYQFTLSIAGPYYNIRVTSAGPDGVFGTTLGLQFSDDVEEWSASIHYFTNETAAIEQALAVHYAKTGVFPQSEPEFKAVLDEARLAPEQRIDPWGRPYHFSFTERSRYADQINIQSQTVYGQEPRSITKVTPVTQKVAYIEVLSDGEKADQPAGIVVAEFSRVTAEQDAKSMTAMPTPKQPPVAGGHGTIRGTVSDPQGAVVQNANVTLTSERDVPYTANTDSVGSYEFTGLPTGFYRLQAQARGFQTSVVLRIPVQQGDVTVVDVKLQVASSSETVEVTAASPLAETSLAQVSSRRELAHAESRAQAPMFTPRLRKYFPETLLWHPEVITDKRGHAHFNFTMADNITAWSMSVVATNEAGQAGIARKELRTFLPLFLEHDPPKVLTQGDTISLPVVLRNYLNKPQTLETEMEAEPWFKILSQPRTSVTVAPNADASTVFTFRTDTSVRHGKQKVTARNRATGDAAEREIQVHPDGEEIAETTSHLLGGARTAFDVMVPDTAIPGSIDGELRVYPNLVAHVFDAMRGIGARPAGCAEQVTSTAYVSLLALQLLKKAGQDDPTAPKNPRAVLAKSAREAVQEGYLTLAGLQSPDGGFRYWNQLNSDVALTAYVLRFIYAAGEFIAVDASVIRQSRAYLIARQQKSGAWTAWRWMPDQRGDYTLVEVEDANVTAYVTRSLAETMPPGGDKEKDKDRNDERTKADKTLSDAMRYLEQRIDSWQDPYLVGNYAIAAASSSRADHITNARALLLQLAHREGDAIYWNLEANTSPFYGWGTAGRVETTALAVEALIRTQAGKLQDKHDDELRDLIQGGLRYLLTHKDRYCVWYSTQATENAVEAIIYALQGGDEDAPAQDATLLVNGRSAGTLHLPAAKDVVGPVVLELPDALNKGDNKLELSAPAVTAAMNAQFIATWYVPWAESSATTRQNFKPGDARALRLQVKFDRSQIALGDEVTAHVEAERVGFRGYGMMLAEVGLPPGAEVDRASLESAGRYEVQPDRVVFYVWPVAGGVSFDFRFRLRYRCDALTAPSLLYDYYNPESRAIVAPTRFIVH